MAKAFHDQGLKVYIDVVYNHTGEGGTGDGTGRALIVPGLDNRLYELRTITGLLRQQGGPNLNTANPRVRQLAIDSLAY